MTRQKFDELVERIEARYHGRTAALQRATATWVALGLAGILAWVGFLLGVGALLFSGGIVAEAPAGPSMLGSGVLLIVFGVMQAGAFLLVDIGLPKGRRLKPTEAPVLWRELESLRRELQCRPLTGVFLSTEFNAAVREVPRLGVLGWPRTYLEMGLPLTMAVGPDEIRAILAHELAHLSARHGRSGGRIYRIHRTWGEVFQRMQRPATGSASRGTRWMISKFIEWYWPRLNARAFVLSRAHEYQADQLAAAIAGAPAMASALWRLECLNPWLSERFWPDFYREADISPEPPEILDRMSSAFREPPAPDDAARWTARGLSRETGNDDTHPSLRDRVTALGLSVNDLVKAGFPEPVALSGAEVLMGADLAVIKSDLDCDWRNATRAGWQDRRRRAATEARRSKPRDAEAPADPPPAATAVIWESAREIADLQGVPAAIPLLRQVLERDPAHAGANVLLGFHLVKSGDSDGESLLWQVVERADQDWVGQAYQVLQDHYRTTGQTHRLREVRARHDRYEADVAKGRIERSKVGAGDKFQHHGLTDDQLEPLRRVLTAQTDCAAAWLVRKKLLYFPDRPLFVVCVRGKSQGWGFGRAECERAMARRLVTSIELPGSVLVIAPVDHFRRLARKVMAVVDADFFRA